MCKLTHQDVLKEDTPIYKIVKWDRTSEYNPTQRQPIIGVDIALGIGYKYGETLHYPDGALVRSPSGPGIMGYVYLTSARAKFALIGERPRRDKDIIELLIPAGTKCWHGEEGSIENAPTLAAERVVVIGRISLKGPIY